MLGGRFRVWTCGFRAFGFRAEGFGVGDGRALRGGEALGVCGFTVSGRECREQGVARLLILIVRGMECGDLTHGAFLILTSPSELWRATINICRLFVTVDSNAQAAPDFKQNRH